jgi:hypothetical protein
MSGSLSKPFFQDPPDDLDEDCTHGSLLGGILNADRHQQELWIADAYKLAGDVLVDSVLEHRKHDAHEVIWPVLYLYRHALELYLKLIIKPAKLDHKLEPLFREFEIIVRKHYQQKIPRRIIDRFRELAEMDPDSFAFRYATTKQGDDSIAGGEYWVELRPLQEFMNVVVPAFHRINDEGKAAKDRKR